MTMDFNMELYDKSLNTLELTSVLAMLAAEASSETAKQKAALLRPSPDRSEIIRRLGETTAARAMINLKGSPSFSGLRDVRPSLSRAGLGGMLNTRELLDIARLLQCARSVKAYSGGERCGRTDIDFLFSSLRANKFLEEKIVASIIGEDEIADAASAELSSIRRHIRAAGARVREALNKIISSPSYQKALQEPIITMRGERYVVPVKAEYKNTVQGLVHDVSASGATLFIEPLAAVKANNELRELQAREKTEIERILMELSADCASHAEDIERDFNVLTALDLVFAKGKLSINLDAVEPELSPGRIRLLGARHPLLPKKTAVPIDVELGGEFDTLVVTGPNTGGKTVCLKTLGLMCAMTQCGLHVPASGGSELPVFSKILADIGDEQSIEQSLSTFSSHMTNIVNILKGCSKDTLLLFDELGAGTDPVEGAALAIAIIEYARARGAKTAATTHYAELKVYATTENGVMNASCEFDVETLRPTYRLQLGIPGKSNAFAISERLGIDGSIIENAKSRIGSESVSFEETLNKLELLRQIMEKDRKETEQKLKEAQEAEKKAQSLRRELSVRLEKAEERAKKDAMRILEEARRKAEEILDEADKLRNIANESDNWKAANEARVNIRRYIKDAEEKLEEKERESKNTKTSSRPLKMGDTVLIKDIGVKAQVLSIGTDGALSLQAGIMKVSAKEDELLLLEDASPGAFAQAHASSSVEFQKEGAKQEIDLRGMTSEEAIPIMERFLDSASMGRLAAVTIIHGKGTGALRSAVTRSLKNNRLIKSFRLGGFGEGETGVTIVELK